MHGNRKTVLVTAIVLSIVLTWCSPALDHDSASEGPCLVSFDSTNTPEGSPVLIERNDDFISQGWPGNGTEPNPYIIADLVISTVGSSCIRIENTDVFFVIRNCTVSGATSVNEAGIIIWSAGNGRCLNNTVSDCGTGILIAFSANCTIEGNTVRSCSEGLSLLSALECTAVKNEFYDCGLVIHGSTLPEWIHELWNNTVNGRPLLSFMSCSDVYMSSVPVGQVILVNCSRTTISDIHISATTIGVLAAHCTSLQFKEVTVDDCAYGSLSLDSCQLVEISDCSVTGTPDGITLNDSQNVTLRNCTISGCADSSIESVSSTQVTVEYCVVYDSGTIGIIQSDHVVLYNNVVVENYNGIVFLFATNSSVIDNTIMQCYNDGLLLVGSRGVSVYGNLVGWNDGQNAVETDCTCAWDDGVSSGNGWDDYSGTGQYDIAGNGNGTDHFPFLIVKSIPRIDSPPDFWVRENSTGNTIVWNPSDINPWRWRLYVNGTETHDELWNGSSVCVNVDGLDVGVYWYLVVVENLMGEVALDSVEVHILGSALPVIEGPSDKMIGEGGWCLLEWDVWDDNSVSYQILRNGSALEVDRLNDHHITYLVVAYAAGTYNFTLVATDAIGGSSKDTVIVRVISTVTDSNPNRLVPPATPLGAIPHPLLLMMLPVLALSGVGFILYADPRPRRWFWSLLRRLRINISLKQSVALLVASVVLLSSVPYGGWLLNVPQPTVRVAVIDSGINEIPEVQGRISAQRSFLCTEYGYDHDDERVSDVDGHGTFVALTIVQNSRHAALVNARVADVDDARDLAIASAIRWAVEEENCSIVNISYGGNVTLNDLVERTIEWAFRKGALVVTSAGNGGDEVIGSSITSPGVTPYSLTVGAVDAAGRPEKFTSVGPTFGAYEKPDISALGTTSYFLDTMSGTSFAAPRVAAAAAELTYFCRLNNVNATAALLKAALMKSATKLSYSTDRVGAGLVNVDAATSLIQSQVLGHNDPVLVYVHPNRLPMAADRLFTGCPYRYTLQVFSSAPSNLSVSVIGSGAEIVRMDHSVFVNEFREMPFVLSLPESKDDLCFGLTVRFSANGEIKDEIDLDFMARCPSSRVLLDTSLALNPLLNHYGTYSLLYSLLVDNDIAVVESSFWSGQSLNYSGFDAVLLMSPYTTAVDWLNQYRSEMALHSYSCQHTQMVKQYFVAGGRMLIAANLQEQSSSSKTSPSSVTANDLLLEWCNLTLSGNGFGSQDNPLEDSRLDQHPVTEGVTSILWAGSSFNVTGYAQVICWIKGADTDSALVVCISQPTSGARLVASASDYYLTNYGLAGGTHQAAHIRLIMNILSWLLG